VRGVGGVVGFAEWYEIGGGWDGGWGRGLELGSWGVGGIFDRVGGQMKDSWGVVERSLCIWRRVHLRGEA